MTDLWLAARYIRSLSARELAGQYCGCCRRNVSSRPVRSWLSAGPRGSRGICGLPYRRRRSRNTCRPFHFARGRPNLSILASSWTESLPKATVQCKRFLRHVDNQARKQRIGAYAESISIGPELIHACRGAAQLLAAPPVHGSCETYRISTMSSKCTVPVPPPATGAFLVPTPMVIEATFVRSAP